MLSQSTSDIPMPSKLKMASKMSAGRSLAETVKNNKRDDLTARGFTEEPKSKKAKKDKKDKKDKDEMPIDTVVEKGKKEHKKEKGKKDKRDKHPAESPQASQRSMGTDTATLPDESQANSLDAELNAVICVDDTPLKRGKAPLEFS